MARETKEVTIGEHVVVIKSYLTGREANEAKATLFKGIEVEAGAQEKPRVPLSNMPVYERKVLELLVVSFDGKTEGALEAIEDLPAADYDKAVADIKEASRAFLGQTK